MLVHVFESGCGGEGHVGAYTHGAGSPPRAACLLDRAGGDAYRRQIDELT
jgi:hypothetical protein